MDTSERKYDSHDVDNAANFIKFDVLGGGGRDNIKDGVILGSGLGGFVKDHMAAGSIRVPFEDIFKSIGAKRHTSEVAGHDRELVIGPLKDASKDRLVIAQSGREHPYEGIPMQRAVFWVRVMQALGVETLLGSNAVGIITPETLKIPSLVLVHSHIDTSDDNPLVGPGDPRFGPRFPHMGDLYPAKTRKLVKDVAKRLTIPLKEGMLFRTKGPNYESAETIYELRRRLKAVWEEGKKQPGEKRFRGKPVGVVGMSSTFEHVAAQHASQVKPHPPYVMPAFQKGRAHISVATNYAAGLAEDGVSSFPTHEEVQKNSRLVQGYFGQLVREVILEMRK